MDPGHILAIALDEQQRARSIVAGLGPCDIELSRATTLLGTFNVDLRTGRRIIRISRHLRTEDLVRDTARHELAHQAAYDLHAHLGHGPLWKMWSQYIGCAPVACTRGGIDPDAATARQRYKVCCVACGWSISRQRRSRLVTHTRRYVCGRCGGRLIAAEVAR